MFHALGRYGVKEAMLFEDIARSPASGIALLKERELALDELLVGASAHALTVRDRVNGTIPPSVAADATTQHAASLAANLAAQVHRWAEFRSTLRPHANGECARILYLRALALGWSEKWRTVAISLLPVLWPNAAALAFAVAADAVVGDPVYPWHSVRVIGRTLTWTEYGYALPG